MIDLTKTVCSGTACGWNAVSGDLGCSGGNGSCSIARFLSADDSSFYTAELSAATKEIQKIIANIKPKRGHELGLLKTPYGFLLAWVRHDIRIPVGAVNSESSPKEIREALGLKGVGTKIGKGASHK